MLILVLALDDVQLFTGCKVILTLNYCQHRSEQTTMNWWSAILGVLVVIHVSIGRCKGD